MRHSIALRHRLLVRLGVPFSLFLLVLIIALGSLTYYSYARNRAEAARVPERIAYLTKERIISFFENSHRNLVIASKSARIMQLTDTERRFLDNITKEDPAIIELAIFDANGSEIYKVEEATASIAPLSEDITRAQYFIDTVHNGREKISEPKTSVYGTPYIIWALPILINRRPVGMIRATIDISVLWETVASASPDGTAHVYIVDTEGAILVSNRSVPAPRSQFARDIVINLRNDSDIYSYTGLLNAEVVGQAEILPLTDWIVVAEIPLSILMAETQKNTRILLIFTFLLLLLAAYEFATLRRYLFEPLSILIKNVENLGTGNYKARAHITVKNELSVLASVMNEMAEKILQYTSGLEEQVKGRTKELAEKVEILDRANQQLDRSGKLLIRRDLELTRANERLRTLDQMKSDFVSTATHQLRTPLSAIKWTISMLLKGDVGPITNEQRTFLMKTYESNDRMLALLSDLLLSDKIDSGKLQSSPEATTILPDLLDNVLIEMQPLADKQHITLRFAGRKDSYPSIKIGAQDMRAVFQNLIENAVKYTRPGGIVNMEIREDVPGRMRVAVSDTGIGIPPVQQKNIFSRFFRGENAARMEPDGSGLGLFIAKGIIEKHGGTIGFESKEGEGTTFHVELPIIKNNRKQK